MQHIITDYTREAGVRTLERQLATICRKVARRVLERPNTHVRLTVNNLSQYLGTPRYSNSPPLQKSQVGSAMGLAVTEMGGIMLPVEVVTMSGKGDLLVTGQLGDVMRESAIAALSYIRTRADDLHIDPNFQENTDLHIHMPEGAIPKDGPSAGITIATALISALTRRPVRGDVAMTGEVTLLGSVLSVGGLKEKVLAAQQANINHLIIPAANKKDLSEIPAKIRQRLHISLVDTMDQVIRLVLLPPAPELVPEQSQSTLSGPLPLRRDDHVLIDPEGQYHNDGLMHQESQLDSDGALPPFIIPEVDQNSPDYPSSARAEKDDPLIGE
jgi:ATP-dependent Lon protease